ncbi:unnamed protein product [Rotaria magnacalcarata]|uniref:Peptidase A2 domain-containing protein n=1 Tax=Rotaria magnacalcarata TaxID=392030 RepID=A0A816XTK2_9BILA|nr:unnamed protein product [Rotaria magnacalcarata]CAF5202025.1 unnamed protein product [Rotaria magnacalcarata]
MVAASQPREQLNPSYYQQPYRTYSEKFNYPFNRPVENHQQQTRNVTFSYEQKCVWTNRTYTKILSTTFKLITETANDGTVSDANKIPSTPLIVRLEINNKFIDSMIDTGSAKSIIHINTLYKLIHRPYINYQNRLHSTANNGELRTIGSVNLRIRLKNILTFILAEVAIDLCTGLVLGNDWISKNEIDIITTQKCIRKRRGSYVATIPFSNYYQEAYPVYPIY